MANHLTPEELSDELGMDRDEIIRLCIEEGVPIYHGKIDKHLFQVQLQALGLPVAQPAYDRFGNPGCLPRTGSAPYSRP